jgi:glycine/D-amino acid oxidase-like deaminating enzyme
MRSRTGRAVVIGGGFYGCCVALFLKQRYPQVTLLESGSRLLRRASYNNQARIHNGYHYPRSFLTALRSVVNFPRFVLDFAGSVDCRFTKLYAIARLGSKVNAYQFSEFCRNIGAPCRLAPVKYERLFNSSMIEAVFEVKEFAFDAAVLAEKMWRRLRENEVQVHFGAETIAVESGSGDSLRVRLADGSQREADCVANCTYSRINTVLRNSGVAPLAFKHEIAELCLMEPPPELKGLGITVMDGPFFSTMPFPAEGVHSLSHVRYTPQHSWVDDDSNDPYRCLQDLSQHTRYLLMKKDGERFLPGLAGSRYVRSLFEVKTVLIRNESDDGRPILFARHPEIGNFFSVMGGKIDNVYDVLTALENLSSETGTTWANAS